ncbi:hypothetical protein ACFRAQ_16395 [Nocardia sp. NPDC056611]
MIAEHVAAFVNSRFYGPILAELTDIRVIDLIDRAWNAGILTSGAVQPIA